MFHWNEMLNWWLPGCMIGPRVKEICRGQEFNTCVLKYTLHYEIDLEA